MYLTDLRKAKAEICCRSAAIYAYVGDFNFQAQAAPRHPVWVRDHLFQEVTMLPVTTLKEKAAGATAASSAQMSAITGKLIYHPFADM
jgi:hypothetical protein